MTREEIIAKLIEHRAELEAAGAEHVSLFGSVARGEHGPDSDIDILVRIAEPFVQSGFGYYSALETLSEKISEITGHDKIDVVAEPLRRLDVRERVEKDRAVAF